MAAQSILSWHTLRIAMRMIRRDWRAGELRVLLAAVVIAVACVSSVGFFTDRIQQALNHQSGELLGADLRVAADHPLPAWLTSHLAASDLRRAETRSFRSMIQYNGKSQLAEIKAASAGYPLRGVLKIAPALFANDNITHSLPASGELWAGPRLLQKLGAKVGDELQLGNIQLRISAVLSYEPDRSGDLFSIAPRLLMNLDDLAATGLVQEGSRIRYRLLLAGTADAIETYRQKITPLLQRGEFVEGAKDARREVRIALQRAQQFLGLSAVVAVMLACVAIAMAARRYAQRHLDTCAMLRCFGASQNRINLLFLFQLLALALLSGPVGVLFGFVAQEALVSLLGQLFIAALPAPSWTPVWVGLLVALGGVLGFALPPVLQLRDVPALRVLRRVSNPTALSGQPLVIIAYLLGFAALALLIVFQAGDVVLGLVLIAGFLLTAFLFWILARLFLAALKWFLSNAGTTRQWGLQNLTRNTRAATTQVMAFGVGIMVLLLLGVVRADLLQAWSQSLSDDAPNRFVVNIQPQQLDEVKVFFAQRGMTEVELFPMVRGRLVEINGTPIAVAEYENPRARGLLAREFNLSWADKMQVDNKLVQGEWWGSKKTFSREFSVEEGMAKTLGIQLGDQLTYQIAGENLTATVSNLRSVQWDSFRTNFYVLTPPGVLDSYPASYITSFFLPGDKVAVLDELVKNFPNLTVIDIAAIMDQVRLIVERVSLAVEFVFLFTLAAGLMVMAAAIQSTLDTRLHENAVLRALGAQRRRLWKSLLVEFFTLGALSGLLAALFASVLGLVIAQNVLELDYVLNPWLWLVGLLGGGVGVGLAGVIGTRQVVNSPPLQVLRRL